MQEVKKEMRKRKAQSVDQAGENQISSFSIPQIIAPMICASGFFSRQGVKSLKR